jgi:hypothetical protein
MQAGQTRGRLCTPEDGAATGEGAGVGGSGAAGGGEAGATRRAGAAGAQGAEAETAAAEGTLGALRGGAGGFGEPDMGASLAFEGPRPRGPSAREDSPRLLAESAVPTAKTQLSTSAPGRDAHAHPTTRRTARRVRVGDTRVESSVQPPGAARFARGPRRLGERTNRPRCGREERSWLEGGHASRARARSLAIQHRSRTWETDRPKCPMREKNIESPYRQRETDRLQM